MEAPRDLTRTTLAVLFVSALIVTTIWIVRPFLTSFLWATMIVIATWPVLLKLQAWLWGRRGLATAAMVVVLLLVLVIPLGLSVGALVRNMDGIIAWVNSVRGQTLPPLPGWVVGVPVAGAKLSAAWQRVTSEGVAAQVVPYADRILAYLASTVGGVGMMILQFLLTVIISAVLYANGEAAGKGVLSFAYRLAGPSGEKAARLAGNSVRGVAVGVVVTAITQTLIAVLGLVIASIPGTPLIAAAILVFCLAQLGPMLVMIPVLAWAFYARSTLVAVVLLAITLVAGTIDNVLRPLLIRKGADLPLVLILVGVIGGMVGLGIMGIFVGPVILAVSYTLLQEWVTTGPNDAARNAPEQSG
jgi:predicted PurR-regulated permease PerM